MSEEDLRNEIAELKQKVQQLEEQKNNAYAERNKCVAVLARIFPSGIRKTDIPGWDKEWENCVYIDLPTGQCSWHYHGKESYLFKDLGVYPKPYDGHTTEKKYARMERYISLRDVPHAMTIVDEDKVTSFIVGMIEGDGLGINTISESKIRRARIMARCMTFTKGHVSPDYIRNLIEEVLRTLRTNPRAAPSGLLDRTKKLEW